MFNLGPGELVVIFFVILIFFGAKRLPELARGLGKGIKEFKSALNDVQNEIKIEDKNNNTSTKSNEKNSQN